MKKLVTIILVSLATMVQAGELKIVETSEGITAEYAGSPSEKNSDKEVPATTVDSRTGARVKFLNARIEQLGKEADGLAKLSGTETEDELMKKNALAEEKKRQAENYAQQISQMADTGQKAESGSSEQDADLSLNQRSQRQELKRQVRELKTLRMRDTLSSAPQ